VFGSDIVRISCGAIERRGFTIRIQSLRLYLPAQLGYPMVTHRIGVVTLLP
jgi:hypothetical protein